MVGETPQQQQIDIYQILAFLWRRKWLIVFLFIPIFALTELYILRAPRIYRAQITLSIVPQKVPPSYVKSTVSGDLEAFIHSIWQEITSRRNLEMLIKEYNLYPHLVERLPMESVVERMRRAIKVTRPRGGRRNVFIISFEYTDPQLTAKVVNRIANIFIEENLKLREEQAKTITAFLDEELRRIEKELRDRERRIQEFKIKYMDELPEQKQSIIATLDRLQKESEALQMRKQMLEDRRVAILEQLKMAQQLASVQAGSFIELDEGNEESNSYNSDLEALEAQYKALLMKYTEKHPDVQRLKRIIEAKKKELEAQEASQPEGSLQAGTESEAPEPQGEIDVTAQFRAQLESIDAEIKRINEAYQKIQEQIKIYQTRLENIPRREQELKDMARDYKNLMDTYRMLMDKKIQAAMAETLEKRQQGEQFKIIDPARVPEVPVKPDTKKILIMGFIAALGVGIGLAFVIEFFLDRRIYDPGLLEKQLNVRVLATIPLVIMPAEKRRALLKSLVLSGLALCGLAVNVGLLLLVLKGHTL